MKNLIYVAFLFLMAATTSFAQTGKKAFKEAEKVIKKYNKNPLNDELDVAAAVTMLSSAFEDADFASEGKNWLKQGELLNGISDATYIQYATDNNFKSPVPDAAMIAYKAYSKAMEMGQEKKALKGMMSLENHLNNAAAMFYTAKDYKNAFSNFQKTLEIKDMLTAKGKDSRLDADPAVYSDQVLFTAVSAYYGGDEMASKPYFTQLKEMGKSDAIIYDALYNIYNKEGDAEKATMILEAGREANPDDTGLLFTEINHYLQSGQLEVLTGKLEQAIAKEPDNVSVYVTMGSVYDQLHQQSTKDGDAAKAGEYFDKAMDYYNQGLAKEPKNFDATYSVGALYYNKAANMVGTINELANDFSSAGMKQYDAKKKEMDSIFGQALPFFEKAEAIDGTDKNTLIALKEIYARLNQLDKAEAYKMKLEGM